MPEIVFVPMTLDDAECLARQWTEGDIAHLWQFRVSSAAADALANQCGLAHWDDRTPCPLPKSHNPELTSRPKGR